MKKILSAILISAALALSGCGTDSTTSTSTTTPAPASVPGAPTAMQTWVSNNWLIFYDAGKYGAIAYINYGVQHQSTKTQLAQDVKIASTGLTGIENGQGVTTAQITTAITNAGGNAGTKSETYATIGSTLSPFLAPALDLLGGDAKAIIEALALIADGMNEEANDILGTPVATPTSNPFSSAPIASPSNSSTSSSTTN